MDSSPFFLKGCTHTVKDKVGHENEHEHTKYPEFWKRTNSSELMSNTVNI